MRSLLCLSLCAALLAGTAQAKVPLVRDVTGHVTVPVFVNGKGPFQFMLDTGADGSAVYAWFAGSLGLSKGAHRELSGATGSAPMTGALLDKLSVDGHAVKHIDADTVPDRADGVRIAGIVGADMMIGRLTVIDFGCGTFASLPRQRPSPRIVGAGATAVAAGSIKDGKQLSFPVTLNGVAGVAMLDSGARSTMINTRFAAAAGVAIGSDAFHDGEPARGATQTPVPSRIGPIGTVRFLGIIRENVVARVVDLPAFEDEALDGKPVLNLGADLMAGTRLTVDYSARRFWFAPSLCRKAATAGTR